MRLIWRLEDKLWTFWTHRSDDVLPPGTYGVSDSWGGRIEPWRVVKGAA